MNGPCMCGDTCCPSCGPAQGNWRCPICGEWASECCEHITDDGRLMPQFEQQANEIAKRERETEEALIKSLTQPTTEDIKTFFDRNSHWPRY